VRKKIKNKILKQGVEYGLLQTNSFLIIFMPFSKFSTAVQEGLFKALFPILVFLKDCLSKM
jgi:hypothetical protein